MLMNPSIAGAIAFFVFRTMISSRPDTAEDIKPEDLKVRVIKNLVLFPLLLKAYQDRESLL